MRVMKYFAVFAVVVGLSFFAASPAKAQVSVTIGAAPVCPYGYFDYTPYACAPYGYYGPEWFEGGIFIGAGPWFHGPHGFHGHVNNRFDPHHGYHGPLPGHGDRAVGTPGRGEFHGNETRGGYDKGHRH